MKAGLLAAVGTFLLALFPGGAMACECDIPGTPRFAIQGMDAEHRIWIWRTTCGCHAISELQLYTPGEKRLTPFEDDGEAGERELTLPDYGFVKPVPISLSEMEKLGYRFERVPLDPSSPSGPWIGARLLKGGSVVWAYERILPIRKMKARFVRFDDPLGVPVGLFEVGDVTSDESETRLVIPGVEDAETQLGSLPPVKNVRKTAARMWNDAGMEEYRKGRFRKAFSMFEKAFSYDDTYVLALLNRACAEVRIGKKGEAMDTLAEALERDRPLALRKMRTDCDFRTLRDDPAFRTMLEGESP